MQSFCICACSPGSPVSTLLQKHMGRWSGYNKLPLGVNECVTDCRPSQGVRLPHTVLPGQVLVLHCDLDQDKTLIKDEQPCTVNWSRKDRIYRLLYRFIPAIEGSETLSNSHAVKCVIFNR